MPNSQVRMRSIGGVTFANKGMSDKESKINNNLPAGNIKLKGAFDRYIESPFCNTYCVLRSIYKFKFLWKQGH